jgi:hypothetical protein
MHLYYSQEVRMYALAMLLGIVATGWLWRAVTQLAADENAVRVLFFYALFAVLALYTLYYTALLLAAHALWAIWAIRGRLRAAPRAWLDLALAWGIIFAAYLPWLIYALPKLVAYVGQKISADSDRPLNALEYLLRHGRALLVGHIAPNADLAWIALGLSLGALFMLLVLAWRGRAPGAMAATLPPVSALLAFVLISTAGAFLLNLRLPFFPEGGERLLLFILPFVLLLVARAADLALDASRLAAAIAIAALVASGLLGALLFYTTPRYVEDDYRPIIGQAVQQGAPGDTFLATFPWMVGYWRAYAPGDIVGPTPLLLSDAAVEYGPAVAVAIDAAVARGTLWFPEALGFGSSLPGEIEAHLRATALNVENRWESLTTRLSAWAQQSRPDVQPVDVQFANGPLLAAAGLQTEPVSAANQPLAAQLVWQKLNTVTDETTRVDLRLVDGSNRTWAARSYSPPGSLATNGLPSDPISEFVGLLAPGGTPPGLYTVTVGLSDAMGALGAEMAGVPLQAAPIGTITLTLPAVAPSLQQMPVNQIVRRPLVEEGLSIVGASLPETTLLAGTTAALRVAAESLAPTPPLRALYVTLRDERGENAATWQGWTLPHFPTALWPQGTRLHVPVEIDLPPTLAEGRYTVTAGWVDMETGVQRAATDLGAVQIVRRAASFASQAAAQPIDAPPLFGAHALLEGYTLTQTGASLILALDWRVEQPLLPPHHIFVHADDASGDTLAQSDGPPMTPTGPAPTGTWQPGEHLRTLHTLTLPDGAPTVTLRVGLYNPATLIRLPVSTDGTPTGDAVDIVTLPAP